MSGARSAESKRAPTAAAALALTLLALPAAALAQDRPSDEDIFGPPSTPAETAPTPPPSPTPSPTSQRDATEPDAGAEKRVADRLAETADTLRLGGQLYLRAFTSWRQGDAADQWALSSPSLLDVFLDARPNDRVRAFVLVRALYDPTVDESARQIDAGQSGSETDPSQPLPIPGFETTSRSEVLLDQAWVKFDAARRVFFTVGKQHVKWGVGRFWNPTDYLHVSPRNPLAVFDARTGTTMVRVQVPWEERGWNFHAAAILEPLLPAETGVTRNTQQIGTVGGAARAEFVLGTAELGIDGVVQRGTPSRLGIDLSAGIWELDLYGELALRSRPERQLWREVDPSAPLLTRFAPYDPSGVDAGATLGGTWSWKYSDEDSLTLGAEYAWEKNGYSDSTIYPWLLVQGDYTPFRIGRHYAGVFATLPNPGSWNNTTFTVSTLGNLSDASFISRVDWSVLVLTYLRVEAFGAVHYGHSGGELRFGIDLPPIAIGNGQFTPAVHVGDPVLDLGVALRVSL